MTRVTQAAEIFRPDLLEDRAALVTGGGSGIGLGISGALAALGARVAIASRSLERLEEAARDLEDRHGGRVLPLTTNVREPDTVAETVERAAGELGGLDILVNNAAGNFYCDAEELSPGGWRAVVETDLDGTFYTTRAAHPFLRESDHARVISISMTLHYRGWPGMAHATAAKAGVDALTRTLALEWADDGIRVNAVAPGPTPTEGVRKAFEDPGEGVPDLFARAAGMEAFARAAIPLRRMGTPEEIGNVVAFLASPAGDWITGSVFVVDGGEWLQKMPLGGDGPTLRR